MNQMNSKPEGDQVEQKNGYRTAKGILCWVIVEQKKNGTSKACRKLR